MPSLESLSNLALVTFDAPERLLAAFGVLILAYAFFHLLGFGTGLIASTPLAWVMPVPRIIPLLALLDALSALQRGWRARKDVDKSALGQLIPSMALGQALGVGLLKLLPLSLSAGLLGGFVMLYGLHGLRPLPGLGAWRGPTVAYGLFGGIMGGMFGSGGFVYAACLKARHGDDRARFRATQAVVISLSTLWRIALCALAGLVDLPLLLTALLLLPALPLGAALGNWLDKRLDAKGFARLLNGFLVISGVALVLRGL